MRLLLFFILIALLSCTTAPKQKEPFATLLSKCNEVTINFFNNGDTIHFQTKDSVGVKYLTQNILGTNETIADTCKPVGNIFYRANGDTLISAAFAVLPTVNKKDCSYISYSYQNTSYKNKLSEKVQQLLTQMYPKPVADSMASSDSMMIMEDSLPPSGSTKK